MTLFVFTLFLYYCKRSLPHRRPRPNETLEGSLGYLKQQLFKLRVTDDDGDTPAESTQNPHRIIQCLKRPIFDPESTLGGNTLGFIHTGIIQVQRIVQGVPAGVPRRTPGATQGYIKSHRRCPGPPKLARTKPQGNP